SQGLGSLTFNNGPHAVRFFICASGLSISRFDKPRIFEWGGSKTAMHAMRIPDDEMGGKNTHSGYIESSINECQPRSQKRATSGCHRLFQ
ncbi:MAG: hypothetical protein WAV91_10365, partial [Aquabacterium sp.]